ncbi:hypothetical protein WICPIJ_007017 [Wickerhamomyces pijperi]|uniref:alpha-1,2-Mannosidase n=1 Tax=Wickerhamomyces pijperi TaxID=599730 RepID=A0A9P8TKG4_WICPI|nr:hypothetical protein WICPIJ_007017 [Wickerhamomyces pijperi]
MLALIGHRFKKIRFLLLVIVTFTLLFYYSFLNEEFELNTHLEEDELPLVTNPSSSKDQSGQNHSPIAPKKGFQENIPDHHPEERLSDPDVLKIKNQYFPLYGKEQTQGRKKGELPSDYFEGQKSFKLRDWKKKERYPVGKENYHKIPKLLKPTDYPTIQAQVFTDDGQPVKEKLQRIKAVFDKSWKVYKDNAYGHDEVTPITGQPSDPFNGWAATLVDTLDTLLLMNEKDEFNEAVAFIKKINFKQSLREDIPIFENVIRILGGLISAYDLSANEVLLESATDLAGLIMEAFDTPNRMPLLYYQWRNPVQNRFASNDAYLSEVGSLGLEFSRLSQITGDMQYYDAITRITDTFERSKKNFYLDGLIANDLDLSGCTVLNKVQIDQGSHLNNPNVIKSITNGRYIHCLKNDEVHAKSSIQYYSMGGLADSFYEYLPKMYHFLRGEIKSSTVYKDFYLGTIQSIKDFMIFKPKIPQVNPDIRYISSIAVRNTSAGILEVTQDLDMQHLTCFAGGMIALGARLFSRPDDIKLAEQVTLGCYDLYKRLGVMPERITVDKSEYAEDVYDEAKRIKLIEQIHDNSGPIKTIHDGRGSNGLVSGGSAERKKVGKKNEKQKRGTTADPIEAELKSKLTEPDDIIPDNGEIPPISIAAFDDSEVTKKSKPVIRAKLPSSIDPKLKNQDLLWVNEMNPTYILRPEAIESIFYMYRITGDESWRAKGWEMWLNIEENCKTSSGRYASILDITIPLDDEVNRVMDSMESFWFAETLKYFYLLFDSADSWSLDDVVLNTEAHAFKLVN